MAVGLSSKLGLRAYALAHLQVDGRHALEEALAVCSYNAPVQLCRRVLQGQHRGVDPLTAACKRGTRL